MFKIIENRLFLDLKFVYGYSSLVAFFCGNSTFYIGHSFALDFS